MEDHSTAREWLATVGTAVVGTTCEIEHTLSSVGVACKVILLKVGNSVYAIFVRFDADVKGACCDSQKQYHK